MKKSKIISIICGIGILATIVIMIINIGNVALEFCSHNDWSLGVESAVRIHALVYGIIIGVFTTILVVLNLLKK